MLFMLCSIISIATLKHSDNLCSGIISTPEDPTTLSLCLQVIISIHLAHL